MRLLQRLLLGGALITIMALPAMADWTIKPVSLHREGTATYGDGHTESLTADSAFDNSALAGMSIQSSYGGGLITTAHAVITLTVKVRYDATGGYDEIPDTFMGAEEHRITLSVTGSSFFTPATSTVRPTWTVNGTPTYDAAVTATSFGMDAGAQYGYPGMYWGPLTLWENSDKWIAHPVAMGAEQVDLATHTRYREATTQVQTTLDLANNTGTALTQDLIYLTLAKKLLIMRPSNQGPPIGDDGTPLTGGYLERDSYDPGGAGNGASRLNNGVQIPFSGSDLAPPQIIGLKPCLANWDGRAIGDPWPPTEAFQIPFPYPGITHLGPLCYRESHWFCSEVRDTTDPGWTPGPGDGDWKSDVGANVNFQSTRPRAFWPWNWLAVKIPRDDLEAAQGTTTNPMPKQVKHHIFLHLIDTDNSIAPWLHPEWNFDGTANFTVTYHNPEEIIGAPFTSSLPENENSWHRIDVNGTALVQLGPFTNWAPDILYYKEINVGWSLGLASGPISVGGNGGVNSGTGDTLRPSSVTIPDGQKGAVYGKYNVLRYTFNYKRYLEGGRYIPGFNADGTEQVLTKSVIEPDTGLDTKPGLSLQIFLFRKDAQVPDFLVTDGSDQSTGGANGAPTD